MRGSEGNRFSIRLTWPARVSALLGLFLLLIPAAWAQLPQAGDTTSPPTPGVGHDYIHAPAETVNPANGSVSIRIPVRVPSGRELTIPLSIAYDSSGAFYYGQSQSNPQPNYATITNVPFSQGGWSYTFPLMTYGTGDWTQDPGGGGRPYTCIQGVNYVFQDPTGNRHNMGLAGIQRAAGNQFCVDTIAQGGEGPIVATLDSSAPYYPCCSPVTVTDGNGTVYSFPRSLATLPASITDRNGNTISISSTFSSASVTDTAGRNAVSVGTFGASPDSINVAGLTSPYQVSWTTASARFTISTFNLPGSTACPTSLSGSAKVASQIVLPNGQKYTFTYDPTYGMLSKITYPSGGYVRYVWGLNPQAELFSGAIYDSSGYTVSSYDCRYDFPAITDRYVSFDGTTEVLQQHFSYNTTWPSGNHYTSKTTTVTTYDLVRSTNFNTVYTYSAVGVPCVPDQNPNANDDGCIGNNDTEQIPVEQTIQYYGTNGSLLKTVGKTWCNGNPRELCSETTTLSDTGQVSEVTYTYNTNEEQTERDEYDYGLQLTRKTITNYASFTGAHIVDLPSSVVVDNGSGTRVAETDSSYDQTALQTTTVVQHTTAPGGSARGNLTTVTKQCFNGACAGGNPTTAYSYYDTGQIYQMTDPKGNVTTFSYTDSYSSCGGNAPPSGATNAYLTQVTYPTVNVNHIESYCYDYTAGLLRGSTDENGQTSSFTYADSLDRLTQANYPDGGQTLVSYNDSPPTPSVTTQKKLNTSGQYVTSVTITDGIGLPIETELTSDPAGTDYTVTAYDGLGRAYTATNPYRSTGDPTYGVTTYTYDALGRTLRVTKPDGSFVATAYSGNCTTVTDEAGKNRESCTDGLGRMTTVIENPGGLGYTTNYTYDALANLLTVSQAGSRSRSFVYDSLSRLTSATNPESGAISYAYDANGNVVSKTAPAPNQSGSATVTTTYSYDALNRLTQKSYSDGTPIVSFLYDGPTNGFGVPATNLIGRLAEEWTGTNCCPPNAEIFSYDPMGRVTLNTQYFPQLGFVPVNYAYDVAGDMTSYTNGGGVTFTQVFNAAGQLTQLASNLIDSQHPGTLATFNNYSPFGAVKGMAYSNGLTETAAFNNRLQPCRGNVNSSGTLLSTCADSVPSGSLLDFSYNWNAGTGDNGNLMGLTATGQQTFNRSYTFDALNRLGSMSDADSVASCLGLTWNYDAWGNRTAQTPTKGTCGMWSSAYTANNQIVGYSYDAAGNLLNDGMHTYTYDAENRITAVDGGATATYVYDAEGRRSTKTTGGIVSDYVHDLAGRAVAVYGDGCGNITCWARGYVYADGSLIAEYGDSTTYFVQTDHLGSTRLMTATNQSVHDSMDYLPFGEQIAGDTGTTHKFTGKERDAESGLDDFGARYYSANMGRFMSPDWSARATAVPYAVFGDPQSLNLYDYVRDDPISSADLDGHCGAGGLPGAPSSTQPCENGNTQALQGEGYEGDANTGIHGLDCGMASCEETSAQQQNANTPAPTNPDGTPSKPPTPPPGAPEGTGWKWSPDPGNPRGGTWKPDDWKGPNPPSGSWDPEQGHWDIDNGHGNRTRYLPDGTKVDHDNKPIPTTSFWDRVKAIPPRPVQQLGTAGIIIYLIVSEGSRVYPARDLVPIP